MAGLIRREDIDELRNRVRIDEVIGEFVTLKTAGIGSLKGLCPFHDEKTPSFTVRPQVGMYHCFGCGESGDVFTFLQKVEQLSFVESVETLAGKVGMHLRYEDGKGPDREQASRRQRLLEMHEVAEHFFTAALDSEAGQIGRDFLSGRGFPLGSSTEFGIGFAPKSWDALTNHLHRAGFTDEEILAAGLASEGNRGIYDRFRGRVVWPIKDMTARTIGFGARRLYDDDQGPKYLNTPETALYHKNQVLYGLDLAKKSIAKTKRVVIVEGYTDVMAAHISGVTQAVATCGTAFGAEHAKIVQRLLGDAPSGEVVFTFDGDAAGQKAALRAFEFEDRFSAQTFVAVEPNGLDPCDLRMEKGDAALRELVDARTPLFEFVITSHISQYDLDSVEARIGALRSAAEVLSGIRDRTNLSHYVRFVAGRIGVDIAEVESALKQARRRGSRPGSGQRSGSNQAAPERGSAPEQSGDLEYVYDERPDTSELSAPISPARLKTEKGALMVALQHPELVNVKLFDSLSEKAFEHPGYQQLQAALRRAGGLAGAGGDSARLVESVRGEGGEDLDQLIAQLLVSALPVTDATSLRRYAQGIIARLFDYDLERIAVELHSRLQRQEGADIAAQTALLRQLQVLEQHRVRLKALL